MIEQFVFLNDLFYFLLNLFTTGGYEDHFMGQILCFTLRGQSYISKVPDPEKAFNMLFLGRVRVHGKKAESDPFPGGMPTLAQRPSESMNVETSNISQTTLSLFNFQI